MGINEYGGVLDALANYWFTKIECIDAAQSTAVPEYNLEDCAEASLYHCLQRRGLAKDYIIEGTFRDGFTAGLQIAAALIRQPFDCEMSLRQILERLVAAMKEEPGPYTRSL